jgi:hypothetical protein
MRYRRIGHHVPHGVSHGHACDANRPPSLAALASPTSRILHPALEFFVLVGIDRRPQAVSTIRGHLSG